jgi:RimJ/RimL family protein N-acetyltransferase
VKIVIRPIHEHDDERLVAFHESLSPETQRLRFFSQHPHLSTPEVTRFVNVDGIDRVALVAVADDDIVAVARFDRTASPDEAEVAFVVRDDMQGHGIASDLLRRLSVAARQAGITRFVAETLPENRRMLHVFHGFSPGVMTEFRQGVVHVTIPLVEDAARAAGG